ncbi:MAG: ATP-binding protein [Steroidobacteraceae bacterium]
MMSQFLLPQLAGWSVWRRCTIAGGYVASYVLLDWLSYLQGITPWNPQSGLTLALLLAAGTRAAPLTALAALLAEIVVRDAAGHWLALCVIPLTIAAGYAVMAQLLRKRGVTGMIETPEHVVTLVCVTAPLTLIVAMLYVWSYKTSIGTATGSNAVDTLRYWVGDLNGVLTLTPLFMAAKHWRRGVQAVSLRRWEVLAQAASIIAALWIRFGQRTISDLVYVYPLFVPIIWVAFRWGVLGTAFSTLMFQIGLIIAANNYADEALLTNMQVLAVTLGSTSLLLGSVVSSRAAALRRVAAREAEQHAILITAPDAVIATDAQAHIVSANPAAVQLFQLTEAQLLGQQLLHRLPTIQLQTFTGRISLEALRGDGSSFPADIAWARLDAPAAEGFILIVRDVSERIASEARLRERETVLARAMRFAVVGELASALTHELNQPITALVSYLRAAQILAAPLNDQDARLPETLSKAAKEAIRTADVLRRLRDFYLGGAAPATTVNLQELVEAVVKTYEDRVRQLSVRLRSVYAAELPLLTCDRTQLEMVLHNLLNNALDALAGCPDTQREIILTVSRHNADILLAMDDSGPGVSTEVAASLFDPFVTTKPTGMGLGLAISRSLLRSHGGDLWSEAGRLNGARFVMRIPLIVTTRTAI